MVAPAAYKLRKTLKQYDEAANAPVRKAIKMLTKVIQKVSDDPHKLALMPEDKELWIEAVGNSYGSNRDFPGLVGNRWLQTLQKNGVASCGYDKVDWDKLLQKLLAAEAKLATHSMSLVHMAELTTVIKALEAAAPESGGGQSEDDESSGDEPHEEHAKKGKEGKEGKDHEEHVKHPKMGKEGKEHKEGKEGKEHKEKEHKGKDH
ncbi:hypothetical protein HYH03_005539 [Edaphochlamys debaryana]|uniref:Uncharacterized protein n=1 Tax=Edaphochlamys debaryana TaxID=47281 RepID=A0A835Y5D1_9CHLO|nr:hypothetical protein HYH03_005539 [Edaphochlamys debaryana]|eukprot:KAG2496306.1 hypothetical protein HYH03_005539 [Edaphochlamys debaryana]